MKTFIEWLVYLLSGALFIAISGAGIGIISWCSVESVLLGGVI